MLGARPPGHCPVVWGLQKADGEHLWTAFGRHGPSRLLGTHPTPHTHNCTTARRAQCLYKAVPKLRSSASYL